MDDKQTPVHTIKEADAKDIFCVSDNYKGCTY